MLPQTKTTSIRKQHTLDRKCCFYKWGMFCSKGFLFCRAKGNHIGNRHNIFIPVFYRNY